VYAGGALYDANNQFVDGVLQWTGTVWTPLGAGVNDYVDVLARDGTGGLYAGGAFDVAGGVTVNQVARWTGSIWVALGAAAAPVIVSVAAVGATDMSVVWTATNGVLYTLQLAAVPNTTDWTDILPTNRAGPTAAPWMLSGTDSGARAASAVRFYRVRASRAR
jgi:hypothetical protein